jgi:hypothetical protein
VLSRIDWLGGELGRGPGGARPISPRRSRSGPPFRSADVLQPVLLHHPRPCLSPTLRAGGGRARSSPHEGISTAVAAETTTATANLVFCTNKRLDRTRAGATARTRPKLAHLEAASVCGRSPAHPVRLAAFGWHFRRPHHLHDSSRPSISGAQLVVVAGRLHLHPCRRGRAGGPVTTGPSTDTLGAALSLRFNISRGARRVITASGPAAPSCGFCVCGEYAGPINGVSRAAALTAGALLEQKLRRPWWWWLLLLPLLPRPFVRFGGRRVPD